MRGSVGSSAPLPALWCFPRRACAGVIVAICRARVNAKVRDLQKSAMPGGLEPRRARAGRGRMETGRLADGGRGLAELDARRALRSVPYAGWTPLSTVTCPNERNESRPLRIRS